MRNLVVIAALMSVVVACGPKKGGDGNGSATTADPMEDFSPGFVEISFDDEEEDLDDMNFFMAEKADCSNIVKLEPAAMMGKLKDAEINCLEDAIRDAEKQTYRRKISLLLMADAWAKGDATRWDAIVGRHLEEIDQSDPDLCYKYALYLSKKGPKYVDESIRWADVALENRTRWKGDTYVARVYSLYRLKARAAQKEWLYLEDKFLEDPSEENEAARKEARNQTKTLSREWLEYARSSGKDATVAQQMCEAAAGTAEFCSGG